MIYMIIIGALFVGGVLYVTMAGANIIKDDEHLQDNVSHH